MFFHAFVLWEKKKYQKQIFQKPSWIPPELNVFVWNLGEITLLLVPKQVKNLDPLGLRQMHLICLSPGGHYGYSLTVNITVSVNISEDCVQEKSFNKITFFDLKHFKPSLGHVSKIRFQNLKMLQWCLSSGV